MGLIPGVKITPLKQISHPKGDILHALKQSEPDFKGFGEVYFSNIIHGEIKGWKKHLRMTLNLVVPKGMIEFYVLSGSDVNVGGQIQLGPANYCRLTVAPGHWVAFKGIDEGGSLLMNFADLEHDPSEAVNCDLEEFPLPQRSLGS